VTDALDGSIAVRLAGLLGDIEVSVGESDGGNWSRSVLNVPPALWKSAVHIARDELNVHFFDWLSAVDEGDGQYRVVAHLWSITQQQGILIRTLLPADELSLDSIVAIFPGANWHERETYEMFGITFRGHPDLRKLLLADEFEGNPLRKDFILAARAVKAWPGAVEPGETEHEEPGTAKRAPRRRLLPPGVPAPGEWGPQ
jgi:NADH-quinone oxidoreductase subunit C